MGVIDRQFMIPGCLRELANGGSIPGLGWDDGGFGGFVRFRGCACRTWVEFVAVS